MGLRWRGASDAAGTLPRRHVVLSSPANGARLLRSRLGDSARLHRQRIVGALLRSSDAVQSPGLLPWRALSRHRNALLRRSGRKCTPGPDVLRASQASSTGDFEWCTTGDRSRTEPLDASHVAHRPELFHHFFLLLIPFHVRYHFLDPVPRQEYPPT